MAFTTKTAKPAFTLSAKVSEKGCISIYGLPRKFPVTLYAHELEAILSRADALRRFIEANKASLATAHAHKNVEGATSL